MHRKFPIFQKLEFILILFILKGHLLVSIINGLYMVLTLGGNVLDMVLSMHFLPKSALPRDLKLI